MPYDSDIIVIGCGNVLFKDDGFGPIVINILQKYANDKNDYYDPAVTSYVEDEFDKDILEQIRLKFEDWITIKPFQDLILKRIFSLKKR